LAYPSSSDDIKRKIQNCWENRAIIRQHLTKRIPEVKDISRMSFEAVRSIVEKNKLLEVSKIKSA